MTIPEIGFLAPPPPWRAIVAGSFSKAVALLHDDGASISIVGAAADMDARAFLLSDGFQAFARAAAAGSAAVYDGASLGLEGGGAASTGGAATWDPRPALAEAAGRFVAPGSAAYDGAETESGAAGGSAAAAIACIRDAVAFARERGRPLEGLHGDGPFARGFLRLREAPGYPASLVGYGPGTTPAGDDWLSGYLTARDLASGGPGRAEPALRAAIGAALARTTPAGRALLKGILAGAPPAYLAELAEAVAAREPGRLREAVEAALGHGATSGEDALAGFAAALGDLNEEP